MPIQPLPQGMASISRGWVVLVFRVMVWLLLTRPVFRQPAIMDDGSDNQRRIAIQIPAGLGV